MEVHRRQVGRGQGGPRGRGRGRGRGRRGGPGANGSRGGGFPDFRASRVAAEEAGPPGRGPGRRGAAADHSHRHSGGPAVGPDAESGAPQRGHDQHPRAPGRRVVHRRRGGAPRRLQPHWAEDHAASGDCRRGRVDRGRDSEADRAGSPRQRERRRDHLRGPGEDRQGRGSGLFPSARRSDPRGDRPGGHLDGRPA